MQPRADGDGHQLVPGRVELHLVHPVAVAVERAQPRREVVRQPAPLLRLRTAGAAAERDQIVEGPLRSVALHAFHECGIAAEHVVAIQWGWLVADLVRVGHARSVPLVWRHTPYRWRDG